MAQKTISSLKSNLRKIIFVFFLGIIFFNVGSTIWQQKEKYLSNNYWQKFPAFKKIYYDSVYANKKGNFVPDEILYSFNGGALIKGESPILVNPEWPPVGKYLIGLSALLFNNEHIVILIFSIFSLVMLFLVGRQILSSSVAALIPIVFISFERIFLNQLVYTPLLDTIHLSFLLLTFYFFNKALESKKHVFLFFVFTSLSFGLFISTKFFGIGITVILAFLTVLALNKDKERAIKLAFSLPISIAVLYLTYIRVLVIGYPLNKFIGIQKWIFWYNQGHLHNFFSMWPLLMFNIWHVGDKILSDPQWRITWPIITILSLLTILAYLLGKISKKREIEIVMAWAVFYLAFLSLGDASARYFVILIPILYIISAYGLIGMYKVYNK